jgi:hypothetical protein
LTARIENDYHYAMIINKRIWAFVVIQNNELEETINKPKSTRLNKHTFNTNPSHKHDHQLLAHYLYSTIFFQTARKRPYAWPTFSKSGQNNKAVSLQKLHHFESFFINKEERRSKRKR